MFEKECKQEEKSMEVFWIIILVLAIYIPMITLILFARALFSLRKGKTYAKERFRDTFLHFFVELLNPLKWFL